MRDSTPDTDATGHLSGVLVIDDATTPKDLAHQLAYARCSNLDVRITVQAARRLNRRVASQHADLRPGGRFLSASSSSDLSLTSPLGLRPFSEVVGCARPEWYISWYESEAVSDAR